MARRQNSGSCTEGCCRQTRCMMTLTKIEGDHSRTAQKKEVQEQIPEVQTAEEIICKGDRTPSIDVRQMSLLSGNCSSTSRQGQRGLLSEVCATAHRGRLCQQLLTRPRRAHELMIPSPRRHATRLGLAGAAKR